MSFASLGLSEPLLRAIADQGYTEPTPIQVQAIPVVLQGRDVMAGAQTGTGKTAGFALPLLQRLSVYANTSVSPARHPVRALILTPTRELALQVEESVRAYGKYLPLRSTAVFGGVNIDTQIKPLLAGVEILVATPGRLLDHVHQRTVNLSQVEILVLDEADRMLDMGFMPDLRRILQLLPPRRQNLLFSATFAGEIKRLADQLLTSPVLIEVARRNAAAETVNQVVHPVDAARKRELLAYLIKSQDLRQVLVFTSTRLGAARLAGQLARGGIPAAAIHGDMTQPQRLKALEDFKNGAVGVLVATDVAARGLDIEQLPHVVNFELPNSPEDYVHRIGRTGRAGASGDAISLVSPEEQKALAGIERLLKREIPKRAVPGFEPGTAPTPAPSSRAERPGRGRRGERERAPATTARAAVSAPVSPTRPEPALTAPAGLPYPPRSKPQPLAALLGGLRIEVKAPKTPDRPADSVAEEQPSG